MSKDVDFIQLMIAASISEAQFYKTLLEDHDITVKVEPVAEEFDDSVELSNLAKGIPLLVPSEQLEEAELIIEQRSSIDEEFDEPYDELDDDDDDFSQFSTPLLDSEIDLENLDEEDIF